jgi:hypothetical protein
MRAISFNFCFSRRIHNVIRWWQRYFLFLRSVDVRMSIIQVANSWIVLNVGGGPTDDKPSITLHTPQNPNEFSSFLNIRVADIWSSYNEWQRRGAKFITEPKDHVLKFAAICMTLMVISSKLDKQPVD